MTRSSVWFVAFALAAPVLAKEPCWVWKDLDADKNPGLRVDGQFLHDADRGVLVFWGGYDDGGQDRPGALWEWDGQSWVESSMSPLPGDGWNQHWSLGYDEARQVYVTTWLDSRQFIDGDWRWYECVITSEFVDGAWLERNVRLNNGFSGLDVPLLFDHATGQIYSMAIEAHWTGEEWINPWESPYCRIQELAWAIDPFSSVMMSTAGTSSDEQRCYEKVSEYYWCHKSGGGLTTGPGCAGRVGGESSVAYWASRRCFVIYGGWTQWPPEQAIDVWLFDGQVWANEIPPGGRPMSRHALAYLEAADQLVTYGGWYTDDEGHDRWNTTISVLVPNPCPGLGDVNCDLETDFNDIDPFVLCITNGQKYDDQYPDCDRTLADVNVDGYVDFADIDPFVALLVK